MSGTPYEALRGRTRFDAAEMRRGQRRGRERGCWVYIPAEQLLRCGIPIDGLAPKYRTWSADGRPRVIVNLYPSTID